MTSVSRPAFQARASGISFTRPKQRFSERPRSGSLFRQDARRLLTESRSCTARHATLHVFPAMPVALAVEFGRIIMPKADLNLEIYDQNRSLGGFAPALAIPPQ